MGFFSKARDMYNLQKQAKSAKKELKRIHIEAKAEGVTVILSGEQELISVTIDQTFWSDLKNQEYGKKKLEDAVLRALNKAMKKTQEIASQKMKGVWEEMGVAQK